MRGDSPELRASVAATLKDVSREPWVPLHLADLGDAAAARLAGLIVRRWFSFDRRARGPHSDRVGDLARGLRAWTSTGDADEEPTTLDDYRRLASGVATVLPE